MDKFQVNSAISRKKRKKKSSYIIQIQLPVEARHHVREKKKQNRLWRKDTLHLIYIMQSCSYYHLI